jgi:hypothetical protein
MRRVVLIPLVKVSEYDQGRNTVKFFRFGAFFLRTKASGGNGGEMQAEYIEDRLAIGEGGYDPTAAAGDPLLAALPRTALEPSWQRSERVTCSKADGLTKPTNLAQ